ncbi:MAG: HIT family protein [Anaerolineae bacterium]|nr:HIT family protein [Anaerolineae bacterium]
MGCVFCDIIARRAPAHIVYEDAATVAFMDIMPIHEGHTLVVPKTHAADAFEIDPEDAAAAMRTAVKVARAVKAAFGCDGVNIFQSNGPAAGQTVFHFHIHVLPRWTGDRSIALRREYFAGDADLQRAAERIRKAIEPQS